MATVTESREVKDFSEIAVQGRVELILAQGDTESVVIAADEAVMPHVKAQVEDGCLVLGLEHWWDNLMHPVAPLRFRVGAVTVNRLSVSGSGTVQCGPLQVEDLRLDISGSGDMYFPQLTARALSLGISGEGNIVASGAADSMSVRISGSGNVQTGELATLAADVRISGSGSVQVNTAQTLNVQISGSGSVKYAGQPEISQRISGSGSIVHAAASGDLDANDTKPGRSGRGPRASRPPAPAERPKPPSPPPGASATEQMAILKMVEEGRITPEEAETLLKALGV